MSTIDPNTKVLIVDDALAVRQIVSNLLGKVGLKNISMAENGKTGYEKLKSANPPFDLVISDWEMPEMDGETFFKKVKESKALDSVSFYVLGAEKDIDSFNMASKGIDGYISKFFDKDATTEENLLKLELELTDCLLNFFRKKRVVWDKGIAPAFDTPEKVAQYNDYIENYMPIEPNIIIPGIKIPLNIYTEKDTVVTMVLKAESIAPEDEMFYEGDDVKRVSNLFIQTNDRDKYKNFIKELASGQNGGSSGKAAKIKSTVIKENSKIVMKDLMENPRSWEAAKEVNNTVSEMIENVLNNPSSFYSLMKINTYDYYTYLHSINVCTLAVGLAASLGLDKEKLVPLALGSMLHDMGKSKVPSDIINKPGRLTEDEFSQIKKHVIWGSELMEDQKELTKEAFIPIMQHHEKLNGGLSSRTRRRSGASIWQNFFYSGYLRCPYNRKVLQKSIKAR